MSVPFRPPRPGVAVGALCLCLMAALSTPAGAQSCPEGSCDFAPSVTFLSTYAGTSATYEVEVSHYDYEELNTSTRKLFLNNSLVASGSTGVTRLEPTGGPDYTQMVTKNTVTLSPGSNTVKSEICDVPVLGGAAQCRSYTQTVTYNAPPATVARAAPQLSIVPHSRDHALMAASQVSLGYATPAYVSRDQPRSVALFYTGAQANPRGFAQVDATDNTGDPVLYMSILVKGSDGTIVAPERFYAAGKGANRLAATWDMSIWQSGVYPFTVAVRTWYSTSDFRESTVPVKVAVVNEVASPLGRGWALAGYQRLHDEGDGMALIEGGTAQHFPRIGGCVPCRHSSPAGEYSTLSWDSAGGSFYRRYPDGTKVFFHPTYRVSTSIVDRFGNATTFEHDPTYARVTGVVDAAGKRTTLAYDGSNRLTTITDPGGRVSRFYYGTGARLDSIRDPSNVRALRVAYSGSYVTQTWDRNGAETAYTHDHNGTVSQVVAPSLTDNSLNKPTTQLRSLLTAVLPESGKGTLSVPTPRVIPDSVHARVTDPVGAVTRVAVDRFGNPLRVEAPYGFTTVISRDSAGNATRTTGAGGGFSVNNVEVATGRSFGSDAYSPEGVQTSGVTVTFDPTCTEDPKEVRQGNRVTTYTYTARCQVATVNAGYGTTTFTYETDGRVKTVTSPTGAVTTMYYAAAGWQNTDSVRVSTPAGVQRSRFTYDGLGRSASATAPDNLTTWMQYDTLNRVVRTTNAAGKATQYTYVDGLQSTVRVTDPANKVYAQRFNALGWLVADSAAAGKRLHAYDLAGRDTATTNRRAQAVRVAYDSVGRPTRRIAPAHVAGALADTTTWTYHNPQGRWVVVANRESRDSLFTVPSTRTTGHAAHLAGFSGRWTTTSVLNTLGLRSSVTVTSPTGYNHTATYGYNSKGRLTTLQDLEGATTTVTYDAYGRPSQLTYPTGMIRGFSYTPRGLSASDGWGDPDINHALGLGSLEYDILNRNVRRERPHPTEDNTDIIRRFAYDSIGQLLSTRDSTIATVCEMDEETMQVVCGETGTQDRVMTYAYDLVGNRTDAGASMVANSNRYATLGGYSFEYDADGNVTRKYRSGFEQRYRWNALGQLRAVVTNGDSVDYGYNGLGVRIRRTRAGASVHSLYDGANLIAELSTGGTRLFTHFPGVDAPHSMFVSGTGQRYFYVNEYPGHIRGMFDEANDLVGAYAYDPFGGDSTGGPGDPVGNPFRFMSREMDANNGLYYVRARWYDPSTNRFVSEDPIGLAGGINWYAYAGNDPVNLTDPTGLNPRCVTGREPECPFEFDCVGNQANALCWNFDEFYPYALRTQGADWQKEHVGLQRGQNRGIGVGFGPRINYDQLQWLIENAEFVNGQTAQQCQSNVDEVYEYLYTSAKESAATWFTGLAAGAAEGYAAARPDGFVARTLKGPMIVARAPLLTFTTGGVTRVATLNQATLVVTTGTAAGWGIGTLIAKGICHLNPNAY